MESGGTYGNEPGFVFGRYKRGGKVRKTGPALVHKGELIVSSKREVGAASGKRAQSHARGNRRTYGR